MEFASGDGFFVEWLLVMFLKMYIVRMCLICTYLFVCMEKLSDANETAGINLCQGIFVDFIPDVYLKIAKKAQTKQLLERKQKKRQVFWTTGTIVI